MRGTVTERGLLRASSSRCTASVATRPRRPNVARGELWFARVDDASPVVIRLTCFDVTRRRIVKERTVSSIVETGAGAIRQVQVTPDGKSIVFVQERTLGHLYVLRGLGAGGR